MRKNGPEQMRRRHFTHSAEAQGGREGGSGGMRAVVLGRTCESGGTRTQKEGKALNLVHPPCHQGSGRVHA